MNLIVKAFDTTRYEKALRYFKKGFFRRLLGGLWWLVPAVAIALVLAVIVFFLNLAFGILALMLGTAIGVPLVYYVYLTLALTAVSWLALMVTRHRKFRKRFADKLERQKYLINQAIGLHNAKLKLLRFLENKPQADQGETQAVRAMLQELKKNISDMKQNVLAFEKERKIMKESHQQGSAVFAAVRDLKELDDKLQEESRQKREALLDESELLQAMNNLDEEIQRLKAKDLAPEELQINHLDQ